jgi:hypothetical protein
MLSLKEWTVVVACFIVLMVGSEAYSQTAEANASNYQTQGSVGSQTATTEAYANQGQEQGQTAISGGGSVANSGNATVGFNNSFNGAEPIRYLPVPAALPIENYQATIFGRPDYQDKGADFVSMRQLIEAMNYVDLKADVAGEKSIRVVTQMLIPLPEGHPKKTPKDKSKVTEKPLKIAFEINDGEAVNNGFKPIAVLSVQTKKPDKSNSASLAVKIGKVAQHMQANTVIFLTEGSSKKLYSSGWGVGFSYNYAQVGSKPSDNGSVGSGGFGYSQGQAGYKDLVYLTAIVGVRKPQ